MISLQPAKGESLLSLIFRIYKVHGITDYSGIINLRGRWYSDPLIDREAHLIFKNIDKSLLFRVFRGMDKVHGGINLFHSPFTAVYNFENFLRFPSQRIGNSRGNFKVRFCQHCILEAISEIGFGYLKTSWLYVDRCDEHLSSLGTLISTSRPNAARELNNILNGALELSSSETSIVDGFSRNTLQRSSDFDKEHFIMPCLHQRLLKIINQNDYLMKLLKKYKGGPIYPVPRLDNDSYWKLIQVKSPLIQKFIESEYKTITVQCQIGNHTSIYDTVLKSKKFDCVRCTISDCHNCNLIFTFRLEPILANQCTAGKISIYRELTKNTKYYLREKTFLKKLRRMTKEEKQNILRDREKESLKVDYMLGKKYHIDETYYVHGCDRSFQAVLVQ
ncbi:hypothetical protein [Alteromonas oceanisediminis]|uniref:hypothetical protein n=1 Tax=Alteromonas oceanisediminis TaxID=2836180 RepID=UPI001BDAEAF7|nr:hypothetical protein [Alteromonas oceanisediminis]MBT0587933.1 hypothetical protein [Alteromonas oceanisediminis]